MVCTLLSFLKVLSFLKEKSYGLHKLRFCHFGFGFFDRRNLDKS
jgi:hypothetical protein